MKDIDGILTRLNMDKRKKLLGFIDRAEGAESKIISIGPHTPLTRKDDTGTINLLLMSQNYNHEMTVYALSDTIDSKGKENFQHGIVSREKLIQFVAPEPQNRGGRPKRTLTDQEKKRIDILREQGKGINVIAKELGISNRVIMEYCKS